MHAVRPENTDSAGAPVVALRGLRFCYPHGAFQMEVDALEVARGERVAIAGPSGCGKTTLLSIMAGIATPAAGTARVCGAQLDAIGEGGRRALRARAIGLVHQDFQLLEALDVQGNILLPFIVGAGMRVDGAARARAAELAERAGIAHALRRSVRRLSQGERQRVAICRALAARPQLVLADEPTASLDQATRDAMIALLFDECARAGAALVAVTHDRALLPRFGRALEFAQIARISHGAARAPAAGVAP